MTIDCKDLIRYAVKAPSGHNAQPWKFDVSEDQISILPDFSVSLPVVDPNDRELYISQGCALENLLIAARHFGFETRIAEYGEKEVTVSLSQGESMSDDDLFAQIQQRQCNRGMYDGSLIPDTALDTLHSMPKEKNVGLRLYGIQTEIGQALTSYIRRGNEIQMNDHSFKDELMSWIRVNSRQVQFAGDGLSYKALGNPPLPTVLARPVVQLCLSASAQNKSDMKKINSSSHYVLFTTRNNTPTEWIALGQTLQRFLLLSTQQGIASAFMNQPCEVVSLAEELRSTLPIDNEYPTLILRLGYAKPMPFSPRKKIDLFLV
ncbi:nitroreductase family protein [Porphyromonadaceae bacterium]